MKRTVVAAFAISMLLGAHSVQASPVSLWSAGLLFECATNNNPTNCTGVERQFFGGVHDFGSDLVGLAIVAGSGANAISFSVTDFYVSDGRGLMDPLGFALESSATFHGGCNPAQPPGVPAFTVTFCAQSNTLPEGVRPVTNLVTLFLLNQGFVFDDVLQDLSDGRLRLGAYADGFSDGGNEGLQNVIPPRYHVPEPWTIQLAAIGIVGILSLGRISRG